MTSSEQFQTMVERLNGLSYDQVADAFRRFIAEPTANIPTLLVSITVVVLILLAVTLLLLYVLMPAKKTLVKTRTYEPGAGPADNMSAETQPSTSPDGEADSGSRTAKALAFWGSGIGITLILLVGLAAAYGVTSTDRYCVSFCHGESALVISAARLDHAECADCHEGRGVVGVIGNSVSRTRMGLMTFAGQKPYGAVPVESGQCLGCHEDILDSTIEVRRELKVAHSHIVEAGYACTHCHEGMGHSRSAYSQQQMDACTVCHDGDPVSADCETCHITPPDQVEARVGQTAQKVSSAGFVYRGVDAAKSDCGGCHEVVRECDPCHGIRMPHDDDFIEGGHARQAAFEKKKTCWRCHSPETDCVAPCHTGFLRTGINGHPPTWKTEHQIESGVGACGCHQRYSRRTGSMCPLCH